MGEELTAIQRVIQTHGDLETHSETIKAALSCFTLQDSQCKVLQTLSVVTALLAQSHTDAAYRTECAKVIPKSFTHLMVEALNSSDQFIGYSAAKALALLLFHSTLRNDVIHQLRGLIDAWARRRLTPLQRRHLVEILILVFSKSRLLPADTECTSHVQGSRRVVATMLQAHWAHITDSALTLTSDMQGHDLSDLASLWKKLIKFVYSLEDGSESSSSSKPAIPEKMWVFVTSASKCLNLLCKRSPDPVAVIHLLKMCNSCLPYSDRTSARLPFTEQQRHLVEAVHTSMRRGLLSNLPHQRASFMHVAEQMDSSSVIHRQVASLLIKTCAVTTHEAVKASQSGDVASAGRLMLQTSNSMLSLWAWLRDEAPSGDNWLISLFAEQDCALLECMLCLLDVYVYIMMKKLPTNSPQVMQVIHPHVMFLYFLQNLSFDHTVLLDLLSSPETCFLLYFIKYLHFVVRDWSNFAELCKQPLGGQLQVTEQQLEGVLQPGGSEDSLTKMAANLKAIEASTDNMHQGLLTLLRQVNAEKLLLQQQATKKTFDQSVYQLSVRNKDVEKLVNNAMLLLNSNEQGVRGMTKISVDKQGIPEATEVSLDKQGVTDKTDVCMDKQDITDKTDVAMDKQDITDKTDVSLDKQGIKDATDIAMDKQGMTDTTDVFMDIKHQNVNPKMSTTKNKSEKLYWPKLTEYSDSESDNEAVSDDAQVEYEIMKTCSKYLDKESDFAVLGSIMSSVDLANKWKKSNVIDYPDSDEEMEHSDSIVKLQALSGSTSTKCLTTESKALLGPKSTHNESNTLTESTKKDTESKTFSESTEPMDVENETSVKLDKQDRPATETCGADCTDTTETGHQLMSSTASNMAWTSEANLSGDYADANTSCEGQTQDTMLDKFMSVLIRLRLTLERLTEKQLFPYNSTPLITILEQCEALYEGNNG